MQPDCAPTLTTHQAQPRQRIDGDGVRGEIADVTHRGRGIALGDEVAKAIAQPGQIRARDRAPHNETDGGLLGHRC